MDRQLALAAARRAKSAAANRTARLADNFAARSAKPVAATAVALAAGLAFGVALAGCVATPDEPLGSAPGAAPDRPGGSGGPGTVATAPEAGRAEVRVVAVLDGDTVLLPGDRKARLLGFNAPERDDPFDKVARNHLKDVLDGHTVFVEYDVRERDQYGRDLVHLFLDDGTHVNKEMLLSGYSQAYTIPPNVAYADEFVAAERTARQAGRGLWQLGSLTVELTDLEHNPRGPDERDLNGEWAEVSNVGGAAVSLAGVTLSDESNNVYRFPELILAPGRSVRVHTGRGTDTERRLHWGRSQPVWNNAGDIAFLRDSDGLFLDLWRID